MNIQKKTDWFPPILLYTFKGFFFYLKDKKCLKIHIGLSLNLWNIFGI